MTTQPTTDPPLGFDDWTKEEQIAYVQALWNRIAAVEGEVPVPDWHRQLLRERLQSLDRESAEPWEQIKARLLSRRDG